ncbi:MAG: thiamine pyrophosphate-dependent enzyme [Deltaproteobacteria bacterium]|nr:thiamine pyrophosphate-dependent enzyme [Deltaproteobacteria bacterium]MCX7952554.1 thiamine pyrophosphate-dependent enzyme [Deltaproteobacteria bacterium]
MHLNLEVLEKIYSISWLARYFDEKSEILYKQNKCHFQIGCKGHEIIGAIASQIFEVGLDWFFPYYREHALVLGLGMSPEDFARNLLSKDSDPNSHGRQMPMHWGSRKLNIISQSSPTGSQFLPAVGLALGLKKEKSKSVVYVSSGEGACCQGDFHEALNWAAKDGLPIIFVIHNNRWAISVGFEELWCKSSISEISKAYCLSKSENGFNIESLFQTFHEARNYAANNQEPVLIEIFVPRLCSHSISDDQTKYRSHQEIEQDKEKDPLLALERVLLSKNVNVEGIKSKVKAVVDGAVLAVEQEENPDVKEIFIGSLTFDQAFRADESNAVGETVTMVDALNQCLKESMQADEKIIVFGEDVAHGKGGVFGVTRNLTDMFGIHRCFNSPLAESSIVGVAIGLALIGFKPVVEIQFGDYIWPAMNQIRNELAVISYRSKGDFTAPVVIRVPVGGYIRGAFYHSQNIEATFSHFPGLITVMPSNAGDAYGMLYSALNTRNPVLFLEHKGLYRSPYARSSIKKVVPLGKASVVKEGKNVTAISYGYTLHKCLYCAKKVEEEKGISVEVIDLRTLYPLDETTIFESVKKTSRVLIVHEDNLFMGYGAEISAKIAENCFHFLDAPIKRVGGLDVPGICQAPDLEKAILPSEDKIYNALMEVINF